MPKPTEVVFLEHALFRMRQRNIDEGDVHRALAAPLSRLRFAPTAEQRRDNEWIAAVYCS